MTDQGTELPGSRHSAPWRMEPIGRVPEGEPITVSVYLKDRSADPLLSGAPVGGQFHNRAALRQARQEEHGGDVTAVQAFAVAHGLTVSVADPTRRLVQLIGKSADIEKAFGTELHHYEHNGQVCRGRSGALHLPTHLVGRIDAVLGLDTSPIATPKIVPHRGPTLPEGFLPNDVARLYGLEGQDGKGQTIAIIELGGGYTAADNDTAFKAMSLATPDVAAVGVDGADNAPGDASGADGEVALDIQVAGGVAPGARIIVYFAPNTSQGFVDAISQAVHDERNKPSVISISWGSPESGWSGQALTAMNTALKDAATVGVTVLAASGDALATDGEADGQAHVDFPASSPYVLGCGGTLIGASNDKLSSETVWKSNGGGTGGGVSNLYPKPAYQSAISVPDATTKAGGRGVPDVAANADPDSGYRIVLNGQVGIIGGTSAVAPLWAGLIAGVNAKRGTPVGFAHALLYGNAGAFRDITSGDNKSGSIGFSAGPGWDPCTGLGSPAPAVLTGLTAGSAKAEGQGE
jgi:kumamolisin